jgi:predicted dehydrogenase
MRVGIIGYGQAGRQHGYAVIKSGEAELAAVADIDIAARRAASDLGVPSWDSYHDMFDEAGLDAVIVSPPHNILTPAALEAARRGLHILLEKPMGVSAGQADEVVTACRANGVKLMVNFVHRFRAECRQAYETIRAGVIGRPLLIFDVLVAGGSPPAWVWNFEQSGGGSLLYSSIHCVDRLSWLAGSRIKEVSGMTGSFAPGIQLEDTVLVTASFENGALGAVLQHRSTAPHFDGGWQTRVFGTNGSLTINTRQNLEVSSDKEHFSLETHDDDRFLGAFREFAAAVRENRDPAPSGEEGLHATRAAFAFYEAARTGRRQTVSR